MMGTVGERIKQLRQQRRWTQTFLGELVGKDQRTVGNWERGESLPTRSIGALEEVFGVSLTDGATLHSDPVYAAVEQTTLSKAARHELLALYERLLAAESRDAG